MIKPVVFLRSHASEEDRINNYLKRLNYASPVIWKEHLEPEEFGFYYSEDQGLELRRGPDERSGLQVDLVSTIQQYSQQKVTMKKDLLAKAVGLSGSKKILDATAGLVQDAFKLCYFGHTVMGYEISDWVYLLSASACFRGQHLEPLQNLELHFGQPDLGSVAQAQVDVVYMDPMFIHRKKALPKKSMQYLADVGVSDEALLKPLFDHCVNNKIKLVVKRHLHGDFLFGQSPKNVLKGKMIRFDIY